MKKHWSLASLRALLAPALVAAASLACLTSAYADDPAVVRLSFVDGGVQVLKDGAPQTDRAVINMPLFDGSTITTAGDGEAEVEFADGSVARLTPNSSLTLAHLQRLGPSGHTTLSLLSGLAYFELNVGQGQQFVVKLGASTLKPIENSIFRVGLDTLPEISVMQGSVHVDGRSDGDGFSTEVSTNQDLRFDPADRERYAITVNMPADSWDQWNTDRDAAIAQEAASQTAVRDDSQSPNDPGWNDLDAYGNWYPVEGYGDVWTPSDVDAGWDPFGYGYWGSFPGYGVTWISGYPWGWLPYHCGAWNYFPFGWGWVPGGCGAGWSPVVTVWDTPPNYHLPTWPKGFAGPGIVPSQHRPPLGGRLIAVDRGPAARGAGAGVLNGRGVPVVSSPGVSPVLSSPVHALTLDGKTIQPVPRMPNAGVRQPGGADGGEQTVFVTRGAHVGVPVSSGALRSGNPTGVMRPGGGAGPVGGSTPLNQPRPIGRSTYIPPAVMRSAPQAPRSAPPPAPAQRSSPPPAAPAPRPH